MTTLHETISNACKERVAKTHRYQNWDSAMTNLGMARQFQDEASLLAMRDVQNFMEWLIEKGWLRLSGEVWTNRHNDVRYTAENLTTEELYTIWKGEQKP